LIDVLHLLIAGKTGSGKSVTFKCIIETLMYWNQNCSFYMLDFAESALTRYESFNNTKYVESDFESIKESIKELREEMANRMTSFRNNNVENIKEYNKLIPDQKIPYIVFAIDEANGFKEDLEKDQFEEIKNEIKALLKRGRKYGIVILFAVQQTNDQDFCKSWKTQTTRLGHLLSDHIDCSNLTTNKDIALQLPNLGKGEFFLIQEGKEVEKMKGCFTSKDFDKLYNVLKEVYCEKVIPENIKIEKEVISIEGKQKAI
jgi:FtsK/SpoIIIE family